MISKFKSLGFAFLELALSLNFANFEFALLVKFAFLTVKEILKHTKKWFFLILMKYLLFICINIFSIKTILSFSNLIYL